MTFERQNQQGDGGTLPPVEVTESPILEAVVSEGETPEERLAVAETAGSELGPEAESGSVPESAPESEPQQLQPEGFQETAETPEVSDNDQLSKVRGELSGGVNTNAESEQREGDLKTGEPVSAELPEGKINMPPAKKPGGVMGALKKVLSMIGVTTVGLPSMQEGNAQNAKVEGTGILGLMQKVDSQIAADNANDRMYRMRGPFARQQMRRGTFVPESQAPGVILGSSRSQGGQFAPPYMGGRDQTIARVVVGVGTGPVYKPHTVLDHKSGASGTHTEFVKRQYKTPFSTDTIRTVEERDSSRNLVKVMGAKRTRGN